MARRKLRNHSPEFKAKVAIAAVRGDKTPAELAQQFDAHPIMKKVGIEALYRKLNASQGHAKHPIYQHLFRNRVIDGANQVLGYRHQRATASGVEVWPFADSLQERVANHHKRHWANACVVSGMKMVPRGKRIWIA